MSEAEAEVEVRPERRMEQAETNYGPCVDRSATERLMKQAAS